MPVTRTLRLQSATTGTEVDRLEKHDDGTIRVGVQGGAAAGILAEMTREAGNQADAWSYLTRYGWSNGYLMIALADLDSAT
jgi:hypothetical protein